MVFKYHVFEPSDDFSSHLNGSYETVNHINTTVLATGSVLVIVDK